jgi:hypothetical protein
VRLPCTEFDANRVWHDLRTTGGCFAWSSTRPGVVTVTPLPEPETAPGLHGLKCPPGYSTAARVRVTAQSSCAVVRPDAWVTATPLHGGSSPMECHVRRGYVGEAEGLKFGWCGGISVWAFCKYIVIVQRLTMSRWLSSFDLASLQILLSKLARLAFLTSTHIIHSGDRQSVNLQAFDEVRGHTESHMF